MRRIFSQSAVMMGTSGCTTVESDMLRLSARNPRLRSTSPMRSIMSNGSTESSFLPASTRAISRMLFTICSSSWPFSFTSFTAATSSSVRCAFACCQISVNAMMEVSGVRSSWLMMARKSDLYWFSACSSSFIWASWLRCSSSRSLADSNCAVRSFTCSSRLPYRVCSCPAMTSNFTAKSLISPLPLMPSRLTSKLPFSIWSTALSTSVSGRVMRRVMRAYTARMIMTMTNEKYPTCRVTLS